MLCIDIGRIKGYGPAAKECDPNNRVGCFEYEHQLGIGVEVMATDPKQGERFIRGAAHVSVALLRTDECGPLYFY